MGDVDPTDYPEPWDQVPEDNPGLVPELLEFGATAQPLTVDFPVDDLPDTVRAMVLAVAQATQTDPAMPAVTALTVLAAAAGGRAEVEARPGWREPLCLYTVTVARPVSGSPRSRPR